jgi:hypothetical protein
VLHLQDCGEIEPSFFDEFHGELGQTWVLYDNKGVRLTVECNKDPDFPMLTDGWMTFREVHKLKGHHNVFFKYLGTSISTGRSIFVVDVSPVEMDINVFPSWHSRSKGLRRAVIFQKTLTHGDITTELVEF